MCSFALIGQSKMEAFFIHIRIYHIQFELINIDKCKTFMGNAIINLMMLWISSWLSYKRTHLSSQITVCQQQTKISDKAIQLIAWVSVNLNFSNIRFIFVHATFITVLNIHFIILPFEICHFSIIIQIDSWIANILPS